MMTEPAAPRAVRCWRDANFLLAALATAAVLVLHFYFVNRVGGLWRDEVNSLNLAQGEWRNLSHDSFPILFPLLLRGWSEIGLGRSDLSVRSFGALLGLCLTAVFWIAAWWTRRAPPLWSLVFMALNAWVIYYSASLRAYGLGAALIALCAAAAWRFAENPGRKNWLLFALAAVLSVQTLYQNSVLVAAICAGAGAVALRRRKFRLLAAIFLAGLAAAVSLLPYLHNVIVLPGNASPLRLDFDGRTAFSHLDTLLAFPLAQFFWVWAGLAGWVLLRGTAGIFSARDDRSLFAAAMLFFGAALFWIFLRLAGFPVQPWYFLPPVALAAVGLEMSLPRPAGKWRAPLFGGLAATALVSAVFGLRVLDYHFTNVDRFAGKISARAGKNDFVVVTPWQMGITFARYFHGPCEWMTVPPVADHATHRFELIPPLMRDPDALRPVLEKIAATLRAGGTVWVVGGINEPGGSNAPASLPPPPLPASGWNETPYRINWNDQLGWRLRHGATNIECLDRGFAENVNLNERLSFSKVTGWKNQP